MNRKDIKDSMNSIKTDDYMKTRIKASVDSRAGRRYGTQHRLAVGTVVACTVIVAVGVGFGINMCSSERNDIRLSTKQANVETGNENANDFTPHTTDRIIYSKEDIEEELGYTLPEIKPDPDNSSAAVSYPFIPPETTDTRLIVLGKNISEGNQPRFFRTKNYVELPLFAILKELADTEIIWINDTSATVVIDGESYSLNIDNQCTLIKEGSTENIFTPSPYAGDAPYYKKVGDELIVDNTTFAGLINSLGHVMVIDYDTKTVTIV